MAFYTLATGISPVPTSPRVRRTMLDALPPEVDGVIFELGSGWGSLAFPLARRYPHCRVEAYERSPVPWVFSRLWSLLAHRPNLTLHRADFHGADLSAAAVAVTYLYPGGMARLGPKFRAELPPGAVVVSNCFALPGWRPVAVRRAEDLYRTRVYAYRIPESLPHNEKN